jgi:hypothetical protein
MAKTQTATAFGTVAHDAFDDRGVPKQLLTIDGLTLYRHDEVTGKTIFELEGVKPRNINWGVVLEQMGFELGEREDPQMQVLVEKMHRAVADHDLMQLLLARVKFIG